MSKGRSRFAACSVAIFCCLVSVFLSPPAIAGGNASIKLTKTVDSAQMSPLLTVELKAGQATAIPGDTVGYTAAVHNSGATVTMTGTYTAQSTASVSGTVVSWYDDIEYRDKASNSWVALAVTSGTRPGYTPQDAGPSAGPLSVQLTGQPADGVSYGGDQMLGTSIGAGATATWSYTASVDLTLAQARMLADPSRVGGMRNVVHLEMSPRTGPQPYIDRVTFTDPLQTDGVPAATDVQIRFTLPDGSKTTVGSDQVPGLASIAPGGSVEVPTTYTVPTLPARADNETVSDYLTRLKAADGAQLTATATASDGTGQQSGTSTPVTTTEQVPVLTVRKTGPATAAAGDKVSYDITLTDTGSAPAHQVALQDTVGEDTSPVDAPTSLDPGADTTAHATYAIPAGQQPGDLTDTAAATWTDANGNSYGPVTDSYTTTVTASALQPISTGLVQGRFFAEPTAGTRFAAKPADTPAFGQEFPDIAFDPPADVVPHNITGASPTSRPFTDVTEDVNGNAIGAIPAHGNGHQAGVGDMNSFDAVFTGTLHLTQPGDVTLKLTYDTDVILGIGGGAARVNGIYENPPASGTTPFEGYPVVGADDRGLARTQPTGQTVTVHFPAAGNYPYELDYAERRGNPLSLVMQTVSFTQDTSPISVYVGYADGLRPGGSAFPYPWRGSSTVAFEGCQGWCRFDTGAIRVDNSGTEPVTVNHLSVDIANCHLAIWPDDQTLQPGQIMVFAQEVSGADDGCHPSHGTFDTSDIPSAGNCRPSGAIPAINLTIDGDATTYTDDHQVLNTKGVDAADCGVGNESQPWSRIGGTAVGIDAPLPPATFLRINAVGQTSGDLDAGQAVGNHVGSLQQIAVSALDGAGDPVPNLDVDLQVSGANDTVLHGTTNTDGTLDLSYTGQTAGDDTLEASADVHGLHTISNQVQVTWALPSGTIPDPANPGETLPAAPPVVSTGSPVDGARITTPVPVRADITPPEGETVTGWTVTYQAAAGGQPVTLATGDGAPPATLATFDPTLLPNDTYLIDVTATSSNGGTQTTRTSVVVDGNLKLGRFVKSYRDLSVPIDGFTMQVERTYDSGDKRVGDFGVGWKVALVNFRTSANRTLGAGGWSEYAQQCFYTLCKMGVRTSAPHYVAVTFPDGHQETFDLTPEGGTNLFNDATAAFTARTGLGITSTLEPLGDKNLFIPGDGNLYSGISGTGGLYNPQRFQLTLADGRVLVLDTKTGLVSMTDRQGRSLTVDSTGVHSASGVSLAFTRDPDGRITDITGPDSGQHLHYTYTADGDLRSVTDPDGNTTTYGYQPGHYLTTTTGPDGALVSKIDYVDGRVHSVTDANGNTSTVDFDVNDRTQTIVDPTGRLTTIDKFDDLGDLLSQTNMFGSKSLTTSYTYDPVGRPLTTTDPLGHTWTATYDDQGNLASVSDPDQHQVTYTWNAPGQIESVHGPDDTLQALYRYDGTGQLTDIQQPDGSHLTFTSDGGHVQTSTDAGGRTFTYGYNGAGQLTSITDQVGHTTTLTYDPAGRLCTETDALGAVTTYGYDDDGNLLSRTDANGNTTSYNYDADGRLHTVTDPLGAVTTYNYDADGRLHTVTDRNGDITTYGYDAVGRTTSITLPGGQQTTYTYDPLGRLTQAHNANATLNYAFDDGNRMRSERIIGNGPVAGLDVTTSWDYTDSGAQRSMTSTDGTTTYQYDPQGRLEDLTDVAGKRFTFGYDAMSRPTSFTRPNGVDDTMSWDPSDSLTDIASTNPAGDIVAKTHYTLDPSTGWRTSQTTTGGTQQFAHDAAGRLTAATNQPGGTDQNYAYDPAGNLTTWPGTQPGQASIDANDRLLSDGTYSYTYDAEGRRLTRTNTATSAQDTYTWNSLGELLSVDGAGHHSTYAYDPFGRRIQTNVDGTITRFVYDGPAVHLRLDGKNNAEAAYTTAGQLGAPIEIRTAATVTYPLTDGHGNVTVLTDTAGAVVGRYAYDAYGRPGPKNPPEDVATFAGQAYDPATGLYYMHARYYDPASGRFLSEDPLPLGNAYSYANGDPADLSDPAGAEAETAAITDLIGVQAGQGVGELGQFVGFQEAALVQDAVDAVLQNSLRDIAEEAFGQDWADQLEQLIARGNYRMASRWIGQAIHKRVAQQLEDMGVKDVIYSSNKDVDFHFTARDIWVELTTKSQLRAKILKGALDASKGTHYSQAFTVTYPWPGFGF